MREKSKRAFPKASVLDIDACIGSDKALEKVVNFCEDIRASEEIEEQVQINLFRVGIGSPQSLQSWAFGPADDPEHVAEEVIDRAEEEALTVGRGIVRFKMTITGHNGSIPFKLEVGSEDDGFDELPDPRGQNAFLMRHDEGLMNMVKDMHQATISFSRNVIAEQSARIKDMERVQLDGIKMMSELYNATAIKKIEEKRFERNEERKDQVVGFLANVGLPVVASKLLGAGAGKAAGAPASGAEIMLEGFFKTFKPEQLQEIVQTKTLKLSEEQMVLVFEMLQAAQQAHAARSAQQQAQGAWAKPEAPPAPPPMAPPQPSAQAEPAPSPPADFGAGLM